MKGVYLCNVCATNEKLAELLCSMGKSSTDFNWCINYRELVSRDMPEYCEFLLLSFEELINLLKNNKGQWIWGSVSAFSKKINEIEIKEYSFPDPYDDKTYVFKRDFKPFHPLAKIEICAWDGWCWTVISEKDEAAENVLKNVGGQDLKTFNQSKGLV